MDEGMMARERCPTPDQEHQSPSLSHAHYIPRQGSGRMEGLRAPNPWVREAGRLKELGNTSYTGKYYAQAETAYSNALLELDEVRERREGNEKQGRIKIYHGADPPMPPCQSGADNEVEPLALRCTLLQNRAACRLQLRDYEGVIDVCAVPCFALPWVAPVRRCPCLVAAVLCVSASVEDRPTLSHRHTQQDCNEALAFDPSRTKARYRRALACEGLGQLPEALKDIKAVVRG